MSFANIVAGTPDTSLWSPTNASWIQLQPETRLDFRVSPANDELFVAWKQVIADLLRARDMDYTCFLWALQRMLPNEERPRRWTSTATLDIIQMLSPHFIPGSRRTALVYRGLFPALIQDAFDMQSYSPGMLDECQEVLRNHRGTVLRWLAARTCRVFLEGGGIPDEFVAQRLSVDVHDLRLALSLGVHNQAEDILCLAASRPYMSAAETAHACSNAVYAAWFAGHLNTTWQLAWRSTYNEQSTDADDELFTE